MAISQQKFPVYQWRTRDYFGFVVALVVLQGCVFISVLAVTPAEFGSCVKISLDANAQSSTHDKNVQYVVDPNCIKGGHGCVSTFCRKCVVNSIEMESELLPCASIPKVTAKTGVETSAEADNGDLDAEDGDDNEEDSSDESELEEGLNGFDDFGPVSSVGGIHEIFAGVSPTQGAEAGNGASGSEADDPNGEDGDDGANRSGDNSEGEDAEFDSEPLRIGVEDGQDDAEVGTGSTESTTKLESGFINTFESLLTTTTITTVTTSQSEAAQNVPTEASRQKTTEATPEAGDETPAQQATTQNSVAASATPTSTNSNVTALPSGNATIDAVALGSSSFSCESPQGDMDVGISAVVDAFCVNGGLGCFKGGCRQCRFKDMPKSMHLDACPK